MKLIDGDNLISRFEKASEFFGSDLFPVPYIKQCVIEMPAIEPKSLVVHGRWKQCFEDWRKQIEGDECSVCGFQHYGTSIGHYNYCPNCGAKMDGRTDHEQ